jgi:hypothetical protein
LRKTLLVTWLLVTTMTLVFLEAFSAETTLKDFNGHWAASTISKWIDQGLIKGYEDNTIRPDNPVNRAEFVSMVNRAWGISNDGYSSMFQDVAKDKWYYSDIAAAYNLGYISGSSPEKFEPDSTITREQAAVMIARLLTLEANSQNNVLSELNDYDKLADWSRPYVETVFAQGILNGYPDKTFRPTRSVTRAEAMIIIDRAVKNTGTIVVYGKAGTYGPEPGSNIIDGNVVISNAGITLQNTVINGNLLLAVGIGEGDVKLKNVSVKGNTIIKGGGPNSITVEDSSLPNLTISKDGVRIVATGNTSVQVIQLASGATLVETETTGPGFETIKIAQEIPPGATIRLEGDFSTLTIQANINLELQGGTIGELNISQGVNDAVVYLEATSRVNTLNINGSAQINGEGKIETANINSNNVVIESVPVTTVVAPGVTASVGGKEFQEGTTINSPSITRSGSSGSDSSDGDDDDDLGSDPLLGSVLLGEGVDIAQYLTYTVADGQAKITAYSKDGPQYLSIPDTLGGYPVTSIGDYAFCQKNLKVLELPSSVTSIGKSAFSGNQLTILEIPEGVTSIGDYAFDANQLMSIVIPSTLTSMGSGAFSRNQLTSLVMPEGITSIGDYAFDANKLQSIVLPSTLTSIGPGAFSRNQLTSLVIPEGVISIGDGAFNANQLQSIVLPSTLTSIGPSSFGRNKLTSLVIPEKVESIGDFAFSQNQLQVIFFPTSLTSIGSWAFSDNQLNTAVIPASVTNIGGGAFAGNQSNSTDLTIYGVSDSAAQAYANSNKHTFSEMADLKILTVNIQGQGTVQAKVYGQSTIQPAAGKHVYAVGTELQLAQTPPDQNWDFIKWEIVRDGGATDPDTLIVTDPDTTIVMDQDITVNACFQRKQPVYLYGSVTYKNSISPILDGIIPIPEGYIDVIIDGQLKATKKFADGKYGSKATGDYLVIEQADIENALKNGKEIRFEVNDSKASHDIIIDWSTASGQVIKLDLKASKSYTLEHYFQYWVPSWENGAQIDRYSSDGPKDVKIPKRLEGYPVTRIYGYHDATGRNPIGAFQGMGLTSVEIPDTMTWIGDGAFSWNKLKEVTIPGSVTYVGAAAFWGNQGTSTADQKPEEFIIRGVRGSAAEAYAKRYGHTFIPIP